MTDNVPYLKLIDFGLARTFKPDSRSMKAACGTLPYVAPGTLQASSVCISTPIFARGAEVLLGGYNSQCDMWSLGVLTYMLISGEPPFYGSEDEMVEKIINGAEPFLPSRVSSAVSGDCIDFIARLLTRDPLVRMTAREAYEHPWVLARPRARPRSISSRLISEYRLFVELPRAFSMTPDFKFFQKIVLALMAFGLASDATAGERVWAISHTINGRGARPILIVG